MSHRSIEVRPWRAPAVLTAAGAIVLGVGLLLGPTPSNDAAEALRDIHGFREQYVATNAVDLVGILLMNFGLIALARRQVQAGGDLHALVGGVANAAGGTLIALTVVIQSTVDPAVAERFVEASGATQATVLVVGETVFEIGGAVFGVGFLLQMLGIALVAATFLTGVGPRLNRAYLAVGTLLAAVASTMGIGALFDDVFGDIEALLGLVALLWLVGLSVLLTRLDAR